MDHQKAFDTVDHQIILVKLGQYGVCGVKNNWFKSYLADRKEYFYKWLQIFSCLYYMWYITLMMMQMFYT